MITERDEINIRRTAEQKARAEGVAEGMAKGKAEGRKEGLFEVAKKMLSRGVSISDVVDFTGLSEAEIEAFLG
jgi:predicted transposase/invertase (TIGR01784 family)